MRDYAKVSPQFWTGETGKLIRSLGRDAQVVAVYLMTCPSSNMLGLYYLPLPTLCHETGIARPAALKALRSLSKGTSKPLASPFEGGFALYDEHSEVVYVPEMARYQIGERLLPKDNRHTGVLRELDLLRKSPFFRQFVEKYREIFSLPADDLLKGLPSPLEAPSKPGAGAGAGERAGTGPPPGGAGGGEQLKLNGSTANGHADLHDEIVAAWHELLPNLPRIKDWNARRRSKLDARIAECLKRGKPADGPAYWRMLWESVAESDLLSGRKTDWRCDLEWLLEPKHFTKFIEGGYDNVRRAP